MRTPKPTRLQQEILELASIGLSDNEIAARLRISPRSLRFELENIFRIFGVRDRSDAVASWTHAKTLSHRPADECPFLRPFPDDFADCPAYEARQFVTLNEGSRLAERLWTCQHLVGRPLAKAEYRRYGACNIGDAVARERWAARAGSERLRIVNDLLHELAPMTAEFAQGLWELKGDQKREVLRKHDPMVVTDRMAALATRFMGEIGTFLNRRRTLLEQNQLAIDECLTLAQRLIDNVVEPGSPAAWDGRFDALVRFPADAWSALPSTLPEVASKLER
jgi:DNA-binding CsgD family transcriptional regulator